jgi:TfoX/Sxy family transcriptional regulator of competence genes
VKGAPSPPALVRAFQAAVGSLRGVEQRKMFGYPAIFVNGNMAAGLVRDRMVIRLGDKDRERFLALPGATPFIAMKGRVMKQWAVVPPALTRSQPPLRAWLGKALRHARSLPPKAERAPRRPSPRQARRKAPPG